MSGSFYRGTTAEQDGRFSNKEKKIIRSQTWPESYNTRVNIQKVNLNLMRAWIERKLEEIAGVEDEVVVNYILSELEANDEKGPDPKTLEICLQVVVEQKEELDLKKLEIEQEVQRVREMMLKIQGKTQTAGTNLPAMPEISGKSPATQTYFKNPSKSIAEKKEQRDRSEEGGKPKEKRKEKADHGKRDHRERSRTTKDKKKRSSSTPSSRSSSDSSERERRKRHKRKHREEKKDRPDDGKTKKKKSKKEAKLKKTRKSSSSSSERRDSSSLSSD